MLTVLTTDLLIPSLATYGDQCEDTKTMPSNLVSCWQRSQQRYCFKRIRQPPGDLTHSSGHGEATH